MLACKITHIRINQCQQKTRLQHHLTDPVRNCRFGLRHTTRTEANTSRRRLQHRGARAETETTSPTLARRRRDADHHDGPQPRRRKREGWQSLASQPACVNRPRLQLTLAEHCVHLYSRYGDRNSSRTTGSCIRIELSHRTAAGGRGPSGRHAGTGLWKRYPRIGPQSLSGPRSKSCAADI